MLKLVHAADVESESKALDPADAAIEICQQTGSINDGNCPSASTSSELLCRLFSILPTSASPNFNLIDLSASTTTLLTNFDPSADPGNDNGVITVDDNGCKTNQCRHADGSTTEVTYVYDHAGAAVAPHTTAYTIAATCDCDESAGETANLSPDDTSDPFECICNADEARFLCVLAGTRKPFSWATSLKFSNRDTIN